MESERTTLKIELETISIVEEFHEWNNKPTLNDDEIRR